MALALAGATNSGSLHIARAWHGGWCIQAFLVHVVACLHSASPGSKGRSKVVTDLARVRNRFMPGLGTNTPNEHISLTRLVVLG